MLHNSSYLQMHWSRRCTIIFPASVSPHWTDQGRTAGGNAECKKVEAEMEVRWRQDVFAILAWILLHHSMQWSSVEEIPCELQCRAMMQLWNARDNSAMFEVEHILKSEFKCIFSKAKQQQCVIRGGRRSPFVLPHYSHYLRYTLSVMSLTRMKTMVIWWQWLNNLGWRNSSHVQCTLYRLILLPPFDSHLINLESDQ